MSAPDDDRPCPCGGGLSITKCIEWQRGLRWGDGSLKRKSGGPDRYCFRMGEACRGVCPDCGQWARATHG